MARTDTDPKSFNPSFTREGLMLSLVFVASSDRWPSELGLGLPDVGIRSSVFPDVELPTRSGGG